MKTKRVDFENRECFCTKLKNKNRTHKTRKKSGGGLALVLHNSRISFEINRAS